MIRGFKVVKRYEGSDSVRLPERSTKNSAGYDFYAPEDVVIKPVLLEFIFDIASMVIDALKSMNFARSVIKGDNNSNPIKKVQPTLVWTGVKAYMLEDEYLGVYNRSSNPKKLGLLLSNGVGVIDSDYYSNPDNDGEIGFAFYNILPWNVTIHKGDKIGQGIFMKYLRVDSDNADGSRNGGFGSTGD